MRVVSGARLLAAPPRSLDDPGASGLQLANFFAGNNQLRGGVHPTFRDVDADGRTDLLTGSGEGEPARVQLYLAGTLLANGPADQALDPFGGSIATLGL